MLPRRALRRRLVRPSTETEVLGRVLRREGVFEGAYKVLRRQKHALSQSTTPFACTLLEFFRQQFLRDLAGSHPTVRPNGITVDIFVPATELILKKGVKFSHPKKQG